MSSNINPSIIFHIIEDIKKDLKNFSVELEFFGKAKIYLKKKFIIDEKNFQKSKDKFKTNIILNINGKSYKFVITLYFDENHISIFKSSKIGVTYEIVNVYLNPDMKPLEKIYFIGEDNQEISAKYFDTIGNSFKRRFLLVNFPINVKLNFIKIKNMKENASYKINILQNNTIIQESSISQPDAKIKLEDFNKMKNIAIQIEEFVKHDRKNMDPIKMNNIINELKPFDKYFNQNLLNKENNDWNSDEFIFYYHYYKFKLYLKYANNNNNRKISYYHSALQIFENIFDELCQIPNISTYIKICALTSLYVRFKIDCEHKENKNHLIGQYKLINMNNNKIKCYNLVYEFILKIIDNLKEESLIFLPLLQVNSGFNADINSEDKKDIFELSMLNVEMVKRHLKLLMPKLFFLIRHPNIHSKRGSFCKATGFLFIYETSIFNNLIGLEIDDIINDKPEDSAVMITFVILHEIFMHKKMRSNNGFEKGKETPSKFIGPKYEIKNFYYSSNKKNLDPLSIYNKDKKNDNKISKEGESGRMMEYFFENKNYEIINYLKKYIGLGELLNKVDLIVDTNFDKLHDYILKKINEGKAKRLLKEKSKKNNQNKIYYDDEDDEDIIKGRINEEKEEEEEEREEEEEEEEEESEEKSEETKRLLKMQIDCS